MLLPLVVAVDIIAVTVSYCFAFMTATVFAIAGTVAVVIVGVVAAVVASAAAVVYLEGCLLSQIGE